MVTRAELDMMVDMAEPPDVLVLGMAVAIVAMEGAEEHHVIERLVAEGYTAAEVAENLDAAQHRAGTIVAARGALEA